MKQIKYIFFIMIIAQNSIIESFWVRNQLEPLDTDYQTRDQAIKNKAEQRLEALKENRAKHAEIARESQAGQYQENTNFEEISTQKQTILDKPAQNYFLQSWIPSSKNLEDKATEKEYLEFFSKNKSDIKENYRLANKLADAKTRQNAIKSATEIQIPTNLYDVPGIAFKTWYLGLNKNFEAKVDSTFYTNIQDQETKQYSIQRSGTSNQDAFIPTRSKETIDQYAERYKLANQKIKPEIKPTDSNALKNQIEKENSILANQTIPQAQNLFGFNTIFSVAKNLYTNFNH